MGTSHADQVPSIRLGVQDRARPHVPRTERITGRRRLRAGRQDSAAAIASPGSSAPHGAQPDFSDRCPPLLAMVVSGIASGLGIPVWARIVGCGKLTFLLVGRSGLRGDSLKFSLCGLLRLRLGVLDPRLRLEVIPGAPRPAAVVERPHIPAPRNANVHGRDRSRGASDTTEIPHLVERLRSAPGADPEHASAREGLPDAGRVSERALRENRPLGSVLFPRPEGRGIADRLVRSVDQPERTRPADRLGAAVNPKLLVGALSSFLCR